MHREERKKSDDHHSCVMSLFLLSSHHFFPLSIDEFILTYLAAAWAVYRGPK